MQSHIVIPKAKGYKNKLIAQSVGIAVAQSTFKMLLDVKMQAFMVSWDKPVLLDRAASDLFIYYPSDSRKPKNMEELQAIAEQAVHIEFENLKEAYVGELPVRVYSDKEIIDVVTSITTDRFLLSKTVDFYHDNSKVANIDNTWKDLFVENYTVSALSDMSKTKANEIFEKKSVSDSNRIAIMSNIDAFWNNITDLKSELYSSH